jgi:hypothetical protein
MENNNRNPYSKRNKARRQHQQHNQSVNNNRDAGNSANQVMTSSLARATQSIEIDAMNVLTNNGQIVDLSINESMISTASSGLFGNESRMEEDLINNMEIPMITPTLPTLITTPNNRINQSIIVDRNYNPNEDESHSIALRQQMMEVRVRHQSDRPLTHVPNRYVGYYDIKVQLNKSTNPWEEVIKAFREAMILLWSRDSTIKIFVFDSTDRRTDHSFIGKESNFTDIRKYDFLKYFHQGIPLNKGGP